MPDPLPLRSTLISHFAPLLTSPRSSLPLIYHHPSRPSDAPLTSVLLSIAPTPAVYTHLWTHRPQLLFLHHPWSLDRARIPSDTLVLASHEGFDDALTTGWNPRLAEQLGVTKPHKCLYGYKGDPERRIGLVGRITGVWVGEAVEKVVTEFGDAEVVEVMGGEVRALACLNVFNAEVVDRVVESVGEGVVIVTGQRREEGMKRAKEREVGAVVCVGHRRSEEWGIRWLKGEIGRWSEGRVEAVVVEEVEGDEN